MDVKAKVQHFDISLFDFTVIFV